MKLKSFCTTRNTAEKYSLTKTGAFRTARTTEEREQRKACGPTTESSDKSLLLENKISHKTPNLLNSDTSHLTFRHPKLKFYMTRVTIFIIPKRAMHTF